MIIPADCSRAPWMTLSPTPPQPITATDAPARTWARFITADSPVSTPHPVRHAASNETSSGIGTACFSWQISSSASVPIDENWNSSRPSASEARRPPSGLRPPKIVCRPHRHRLGRPLTQWSHMPQWMSADSTTWSPTAHVVTSEPTAATTPAPSWPRIIGSGNGRAPVCTDTSLWHSPDALICTRTSLGPRSPRVTSTTSIGWPYS